MFQALIRALMDKILWRVAMVTLPPIHKFLYGNGSHFGITSYSRAPQETDVIEDMAESVGMVASRRRGRRSSLVRWRK